MAGPREPINLIIAKGKKHLTKDEIERRKNEEIQAPVGDVAPPDYLPDKLKAEFEEIAEKLIKINIMSELDTDTLARYLLARQSYLALTNKYMKALSGTDIGLAAQISSMHDKSYKQCHLAARELGLTISSRCKLVIPKTEDEPESKFGQFIQGGAG
jgi:P27 family predicted phage terminase small subunit